MKVVTTPDPRLRQKSEKIRDFDDSLKEIVKQMVDASLEWEQAHPHELSVAMAAPQLGILKRIIIVRNDTEDKSNTEFTALINPEVIRAEGRILKDYEGCLSVPWVYGLVPRAEKVKVKAQLIDGTEVRIKAKDTLARTLLHEIDHLDGILFIDRIKDDPKAFYRLRDDGELELVDYYTKIKGNKEMFPDSE
ncbi:peptide deformylase [Candidatus Saccharibacteria bacterium]|nr:peptide deformylase [Candidatus Saccharibacteria bacterium]